jgi:hypothetical protein
VAENAQTLFDAPAAADKAGDVQVGALTFKLVRVTSSMSGDHVWMQAFAGDVPVRGGYVVTHLTHDGQVLFVTNELGDVGFELAASAVSLDRASALAAAARIIGGDGLTRVEPKADLVVLREGNRGRLAWRTETATYNPYGDWEIMVDAANGAELARRDLIICLKPDEKPASINPPTAPMTPDPLNLGGAKGAKAIGTGLAFIANPLNNHAERYPWRDGNAIIDTARDAVSLTNLSGSGLLAGPWVEVFNTDAPRANEPTLTYNYSALLANGHFQEVNVYYHINYWQEYMQSLGILNARDRVTNCYAHQGEDDNSDYSPSQDRIRYGDGGASTTPTTARSSSTSTAMPSTTTSCRASSMRANPAPSARASATTWAPRWATTRWWANGTPRPTMPGPRPSCAAPTPPSTTPRTLPVKCMTTARSSRPRGGTCATWSAPRWATAS